MKIRVSVGVRKRPIRLATFLTFDDGRDSRVPMVARTQSCNVGEIQRGRKLQFRIFHLYFDVRIGDPRLRRHTVAITIEAPGSPFARGREIKLPIGCGLRTSDEGLETGVLPQCVRPRRLRLFWQRHSGNVPSHGVQQDQLCAITRSVDRNFERGRFARLRMSQQSQAS